jgi:hypothetical protein
MSRTKSIKFPNSMTEFSDLFDKLQRPVSSLVLNSAGLTIGSSSKPKVKIANTTYAYVEGGLAKKTTAEIVLPASTVTNAKFNVFVLCMDSTAAVTSLAGTQAATLAGVVFPTVLTGTAVIGFVIVNPTGTGDFVAATNDLDDATIVPNAVYINTPMAFLPGMEAI